MWDHFRPLIVLLLIIQNMSPDLYLQEQNAGGKPIYMN